MIATPKPGIAAPCGAIHVALLRAINVGGYNKIAMSALRELFVDLAFTGVKTLLQSGNVVFENPGRTAAELERLLEKATAERLGVAVDYVVRSDSEWAEIVARNPFPDQANDDPGHLVVMCLKAAVDVKKAIALQSAIRGPEIVRGDGKQLYAVYPNGIGKSKLTTALIERELGVRGTARNWNTVLKLAALCEP
jgi:uncharacterized protein (DUF1697 family)